MLNGTSGALVTWGNASGRFHIDGLVGLHRYRAANLNNTTDLSLGARAWYHVHASSFADFSVGGGIGFRSWTNDPGNPGSDSRVDVSIEAGGQIRAFIVSNVALLADLGFGATFGNSDDILFGSQAITRSAPPQGGSDFVVGTLGIAYFFE
jgi:hypothetical protein